MTLKPLITPEDDRGFSIHTIPFGFGEAGGKQAAALSALGNQVVQLESLATHGFLPGFEEHIKMCSRYGGLNPMLQMGRHRLGELRSLLQDLLQTGSELDKDRTLLANITHPIDDTYLMLPVYIGDYTDFYASKYHAERVGAMFRGKEQALQPNWLHLPVGYHGRASSIVPSDRIINWPNGQMPGENGPKFGPSKKVDFELEFGCLTASGNLLGEPVSAEETGNMIAGFLLVNDWSARDIQAWEYVPLGPFTSKNFATSVSPWVIHPDALEPFKTEGPTPEVRPQSYLQQTGLTHYDIQLEVYLKPAGTDREVRICQTNTRHLYWSMEQMLAHQTVTGCNIRSGDLYASGTVSGPKPENGACLLELTENGQSPIALDGGKKRTFLESGDEVIMRGFAEKGEVRVEMGEVRGQIGE